MRNVTLHILPEHMERINARCQTDLNAAMLATDSRSAATKLQERADSVPVHMALGRLVTWALPNATPADGHGQYDTVEIHCPNADNPELVAVYTSSTHPAAMYIIGAVWHNDHWGFHS